MKKTIATLCNLINNLEGAGRMTEEESAVYKETIEEFNKINKGLNGCREQLLMLKGLIEWDTPIYFAMAIDEALDAIGKEIV